MLLLSSLSALSLVNVIKAKVNVIKAKGEWSILINPGSLPALETVSIAIEDSSPSRHELESLAESLSTIAPRLRTFTLRDPHDSISR